MHQLPTDLDLRAACFVNADTGFVGAGGLFTTGLLLRTNDGGATWDTVMQNNTGINSISYTNGILSVSESGNKFHSSTDFVNWTTSTALGWSNWHKHVRLADNRVVFVGGENFGSGFLHSKNPNQNFLSLKNTFHHELRDIEVTPDRTLHLVGYGVVMKSTDEGQSWIVSNAQGDFFRGVDFPTSNMGYVVGEYGSVYKTTNRGDSWTELRAANSVFADQSKLIRDIAFVDENTGFFVGTSNLVFRTTNGGKIWKQIVNLDGYANFSSITIANNKAYLTGNNGQLLIIDLGN